MNTLWMTHKSYQLIDLERFTIWFTFKCIRPGWYLTVYSLRWHSKNTIPWNWVSDKYILNDFQGAYMLHQVFHTPVLYEQLPHMWSENPSISAFPTFLDWTEACNSAMTSTRNTTNFCILKYLLWSPSQVFMSQTAVLRSNRSAN